MLRGIGKLTWLELKIFAREPLGVFGTVAMPVVLFVVLGRILEQTVARRRPGAIGLVGVDVPVLVAMLIALGGVTSLVTIVSIYRESGILKRLRATPMRPHTILIAHVLTKLVITATTLALMMLAGRRLYPVDVDVPLVNFTAALLISSLSVLSMGFVIASVVPTARFAQPLASIVLYPMLAVSGLFVPIEALPAGIQTTAKLLPLTYAVSLLRGMWSGESWAAHTGDLAALALVLALSVVVSSKVFRWE